MTLTSIVPSSREAVATDETDRTNRAGRTGRADNAATSILPHEHGLRLDAVLVRLLPHWGLRARRRLCEQGHVLLNGRPGLAAVKTRAGQRLELHVPADGVASVHESLPDLPDLLERADLAPVAVVRQSPDFAALCKPAGLHSAALAGSAAPSLEGWMRQYLAAPGGFAPRPVNGLDRGTSGLVLAVCSEQGLDLWEKNEASGTVDKRYLALVVGSCTAPVAIRTALDTADRKITRPLNPPTVDSDPLRHTHVTPLGEVDAASMTALLAFTACRTPALALPPCCSLVGCRIRKGARHQIRVHLALQGLPLWGDPLYGASPDMQDAFFLHHGHLGLADFAATVHPLWLAALSAPLQRVAAEWLAAPTVF